MFYDKKLESEVKNMLVADSLPLHTFLQRWNSTALQSDSWIETETKLVRVHVVPRKTFFDPSKWQTKQTLRTATATPPEPRGHP